LGILHRVGVRLPAAGFRLPAFGFRVDEAGICIAYFFFGGSGKILDSKDLGILDRGGSGKVLK
jgi:hypothetical protein